MLKTFNMDVIMQYGSNPQAEIEFEATLALVTDKGSVAGQREYGSSLMAAQGRPINVRTTLLLQKSLADAVALYNTTAPTDTERRVAIDPGALAVVDRGGGALDVSLVALPIRDIAARIPIGGAV